MTSGGTPSTCSDETEPSKPWPTVVNLGQRIVRELGFADRVDTLGRWMAHRIAELMERADQAQDDQEREATRRECADLILRLWAHRADRPHGSPLADIAAFLQAFIGAAPTRYQAPPDLQEGSWINVFRKIRQLAEREEALCRAAAVAELPLENEREWLTEHRDELSEDERSIIEGLIQMQDRMHGEYFRLDDEYVPHFGDLSAAERTRLVIEQLKEVNAERERLLEEMKNADELPDTAPTAEGTVGEPDRQTDYD